MVSRKKISFITDCVINVGGFAEWIRNTLLSAAKLL
jgi:hypothetical protein